MKTSPELIKKRDINDIVLRIELNLINRIELFVNFRRVEPNEVESIQFISNPINEKK